MYDNSIVKSKNIVLKLFVPILLIIILIYEKNGDYMFFHQFVEILCTTFGVSLTMFSMNRFNLRKNNLFNYIGLNFSVICIVNVIHILSYSGGKKYEDIISFTLIMSFIMNYLEYLIILMSLYFTKRSISYVKSGVIFAIASFVLFITLMSSYYYTNSDINSYNRSVFIKINWIVIIFMFIGIITITLKNRNTSRDAKKYIVIYTILVLIYESISRINFYNFSKTNYDVVLMSHIFKYLAFYTLFEGISKFLIQGTYNEMYDELKQMERDQNHYKSILQKRMALEIELKKMMEMSKNKYNTLINSISDSILIFEHGEISFVNSSADNLLKLLYKDRMKIERLSLDDFIEYISTFRRDNNEEINKLSFVIENSNGSSKVYDLNLECINNSICVVDIRDITDIGKVRTLKSELDNYIKDEKTKRQFYTNISHELRTPINVIYSALQLNDLYLEEKKKDGLEKNSENIKRNCLRLIRTINNFIDTNKISEGYLTPTMSIYNIVYLVENVAQSTLEYVNRFKMELTFDADEEEIYVNCDMELLERVILNLLSNSVKYGRPGGYIFVSISCSDSDVSICILNDSKRISEQEQSYIFDKFSKAQYDLNSRKEGSGLGLFISKALVELQGGEIKLDTFENGNRFTIRFDRIKDYKCDYKMFTNNKFNELKEKVDIEFSDIYN
ncbi:ATP-binding protein [Clostridium manihotivorum]|uniref:histidine kinase n=1 Tax=Clostridium manihotivorum TaxID=2320868 RepID=A0A410DXL2_9CLOT|nr:ATP-binding protein [Clostridium manihotivorum]QAA33926.1 hypothetical protein C1I91_21095 [Clostridium manihotivorum]